MRLGCWGGVLRDKAGVGGGKFEFSPKVNRLRIGYSRGFETLR